jgi:hypothetical protein
MKKNREDETSKVIIHIYMEMLHEYSLCSYLKQTKMSFFSLVQKGKVSTGPASGCWYQWEGGRGGGEQEGKYSTNIVYTYM